MGTRAGGGTARLHGNTASARCGGGAAAWPATARPRARGIRPVSSARRRREAARHRYALYNDAAIRQCQSYSARRHGSGDVTHFQPDFQNSAVPERSARAKKGSRASKSQHSTFLSNMGIILICGNLRAVFSTGQGLSVPLKARP